MTLATKKHFSISFLLLFPPKFCDSQLFHRVLIIIVQAYGSFKTLFLFTFINLKVISFFLFKFFLEVNRVLILAVVSYLHFIHKNYKGGPVGIETISAALSEDKTTIEETVEPFLIQIGLMDRTPRGRVLTSEYYLNYNI